ncbi:MAG TPA: hypothetical protein VFR72_04450 [Gemmatimonadales bacterium]|nr:hypothetical protein [Gemmatimonadales bacterium]
MLRFAPAVLAALLLAPLAPARGAAQSSPYLPLDDPRLPLLEHLIARGDIADPSPMVRPFRRGDALRVLAGADTSGEATAALIRDLRDGLQEPADSQRWMVGVRAGVQAYSHVRRDLLHPLGSDGVRPYGELIGEAVIGPFALVSRPLAEPRITDDPEWPGRRDLELAWRMSEAYLSAQFKYGSVFYGQMDRNWGPVGIEGIGLSDYGYNDTELGFEVGVDAVRLVGLARSLEDARDGAGERIHRYFFAHRLGVRLGDRLRLGLWETTVLAGADREFDGRYRNPLSLLLLANQYGLGADGNVLFGLDGQYRIGKGTTVEAQVGIDDLQYENTAGEDRYPNRWAFTLGAHGPLGARLGWRALYTQASSLAFRTLDPFENLTDGGVGLGRNFADMDRATVTVSVPVGTRWLVTPELTLQRQGEGDINDLFPASPAEAGELPQLFIGTVERTWRAAVALSGRQGPLDLRATAGLHHITNAGNLAGNTENRFVGRLQATLGLSRLGVIQ